MIPIKNSYDSQWVSIPLRTLPAPLVNLVVENITATCVTVKWQSWKKIADGAEFLQYKIEYEKLYNGEPTGEVSIIHTLYNS